MRSVIIAHRGASALAEHENTLEAFEIAISVGAEYAEFDIRKTADDRMIVFHNDSIDGKPISSLTYDELCTITSAQGYRVPYLAEVLKLCQGKIKLDIELKETGYEGRIIRLVKKYYSYEDFMMKSFLDTAVARIKTIDPKITAGLLLGFPKGDVKRRLHEFFPERRIHACHADFVSPHYQLATPGFISRMHLRRKKVYIWTVNTPQLILKCLRKRPDGIITDNPDAAIHLREGYRLIDKLRRKQNEIKNKITRENKL